MTSAQIIGMQNLQSALTSRSRECLGRLFEFEDQELLRSQFQTTRYAERVAETTGLPKVHVADLVVEIKDKWTAHLD